MGEGTENGMSQDASEVSVTPVTASVKSGTVTGGRRRGQLGHDGLRAEVGGAWGGRGVVRACTGADA
jgi:hypothetical protein